MADSERRLARLAANLSGNGEFPVVSTTNLASGGTNGQVLTRTSAGMSWLTSTGGGSNPHPSHEKPTLSLSTREIAEGGSAVTVTGTINIPSGYTVQTISTPTVSAGTVTHTSNATTFTWALAASDIASPATLRVSSNVSTTNSGETYSDQVSSTIVVYRVWYTSVVATQPTAVTSMTSQGRFTSPETITLTQLDEGGALGYVALPTRTNGYEFKSSAGFDYASTNHGVISTSWTLYSVDLGDPGDSFVIRIEEV